MKVALVHYRLTRMGGLETRLHNYTAWFSERGHDVTIICRRYDRSIVFPNNVSVVQLNLGLMPKPFRPAAFSRKVKKWMSHHNYDLSVSLERTSSEDILMSASNHPAFMLAMGIKIKRIRDHVQFRLEQSCLENAKRILACSGKVKQEIIELNHIVPEKIKVLHPPLNEKKFFYMPRNNPERLQMRKKYHMTEGNRYFLFVSTSHKRKGLPLLLKCFAQLTHINAHLIIAGRPAVNSSLPNVRYVGFAVEPRELYQAADFTIHPARYEPFGQIVPESLQCGTPVIISSNTGAKEVLEPNEGLVVESMNEEEWKRVIATAEPSQYDVKSDFAHRNKLTLDDHMNFIIEEWKDQKSINHLTGQSN